MNPLGYVIVSLALTSAVLTAIFFIAWRSFGHRRYALLWAWAFLAATLQWVLNILAPKQPGAYAAYWLSVSLLSAITLSLGLAAFRLRAGYETVSASTWWLAPSSWA